MLTYPSPSTPIPMIPSDIAKAILLIKKDIKTIAYDAENKHGSYRYASVDAIYDGVREAMSAHGLGLMTLETSFASAGEKSVRFEFQWLLFTAESTWTHETAKRTIVLPWNGPQTAQAAQSYVEKEVLKSLFKLATGDAEPEGNELGDPPKKKEASPAKKDAPKVTLSANDITKKVDEIIADLDASFPDPGLMTGQDATDFAEKWGADLAALPEASKVTIRAAIKAKRVAK